ncbi:MAG: hypothetical protein IPM14_01095 [bacterium]|nr:hypothetical protein [bacterium]
MISKTKLRRQLLVLTIIFSIWSCSTISVFSPEAYKQAVDLKVESLNLMSFATSPFEDYQDDVATLRTELTKAYEFALGRPDNELSAEQWEILISEDGNLLGGFLRRWETEGVLGEMFVNEMQSLVSDAFDTIIGLESGKIDPSEIK